MGYGLLACLCTGLPGLLYGSALWLGLLKLLIGLAALALGWLIWSRFAPKDSSFTQDMSLEG